MYQQTDLLDALAPGRVEDFITNAFCWLLSNTVLGERFLKYLGSLGSEGFKLPELDRDNLRWETQTQFPRGHGHPVRPDMTCTDTNLRHGIVFEHKAWSELHDRQLENYRDYRHGPFEKAPIVLITAHPGQHRQCPNLSLCWYQVYRWLKKQLEAEQDPVVEFVIRNFCTLLDRKGLGPMKSLRDEDLKNYFGVKQLLRDIPNTMRAVNGREWPGGVESRTVRERWGRLGFDLRGNWKPGVFVGVMLDGRDHSTSPMCPNKGPDACVILSVDEELQPAIDNYAYKRFVTELKSKKCDLPKGWKLYHHAEDGEAKGRRKGPNPWHPYHIRCSLLDVLDGAKTAEAQVDKFYEQAHAVVKLIWPYVKEDWPPNASR
ncbi:MAG: hypothetical protein OXP28_13585 [Gammaproteobacteria bacterium]|nr:hypothetical protein [Gammaproteobacteria bacterium]